MTRSSLALALAVGVATACEPTLGDTPFACGAEGICPDGYTCRATICVADGTTVDVARPMRIDWINAGEMFWFASPGGGATLVVNDGFTDGSRGLYEIVVGADGAVGDPALLLDFGEEFPTSSAVVALDDDHYGVLTLSFPSLASTQQDVAFWSVPREGRGGAPEIVGRPTTPVPFVGGAEPVYVGAVARNGGVDVSFADPSQGGQVVVGRVQNGVFTERARLPLGSALPLSADSLIWDLGDAIAVRVGLEESEMWRVPDGPEPAVEGPVPFPGQPVYAFDDRVIVLTTEQASDDDPIVATLESHDWTGALLGSTPAGVLQTDLEPFSGIVGDSGVHLAPLSDDDGFGTLEVARLDASGSVTRVAALDRPGTDELYSARAFAQGGRVYIAWTSFHEAVMDLWVGVATEGAP